MSLQLHLRLLIVSCPGFGFFPALLPAAEPAAPPPVQPAWGQIARPTDGGGLIAVEVRSWPPDGKLLLPAPIPALTTARLFDGAKYHLVKWAFETATKSLRLEVPVRAPSRLPLTVYLETAEKTGQFVGGRIAFPASEARVQGRHAKLGGDPDDPRIDFEAGADAADGVIWDFKPTRWGMYDLELTCSTDADRTNELQCEIAGNHFAVPLAATGGDGHFATVRAGRFHLAKAEPFTLLVGGAALQVGGGMSLKAATLRPAPEGPPIVQTGGGAITLLAGNAITHSVMMRYEPLTNKNCLGFWVNPKDWAEWEFKVTRAGTYAVDLVFGCGKGNGGSDVVVEVAGERLPFVVADTGDFHKHETRRLGRVKFSLPGPCILAVRPQNKKAGAVMDIDRFTLVPEGGMGR